METQPNGYMLQYDYDAAGNRIGIELSRPDGSSETTTYSYDGLNRLVSVVDADSNTTTYIYDTVGNTLEVAEAGGQRQVYAYDALNRITRIESFRADDSLLQRYDYTLDATGKLQQIVELNGRIADYT